MIKDYFLFPHIGRMDDIWASFYVTSKKYKVVYNESTVYQSRNVHNLIKDFKDETIGYLNSLKLIEELYKNSENIYNFLPKSSARAFDEWKKIISKIKKLNTKIMQDDYFKKIRIFDGGTGQELINRGLVPLRNLWSATALLNQKYHKYIFDTHVDFINAGAEIILTNTFGSRKRRLIENNLLDKYKDLNITAGKIAIQAVRSSQKNILIAGSIPPQNFTYQSDLGDDLNFIKEAFYQQASYLDPYVDFFYVEVMCE